MRRTSRSRSSRSSHTEYLGERLGQIAAEKAGIFRRGRIALCGPTESEAAEALERLAVEVGADYQRVDGETARFEVHDADLQSQRLALQTLRSRYEFDSSLIGRHQLNSLRLAVVAAESLEEAGWRGFDSAAITRGVEGVAGTPRVDTQARSRGLRCAPRRRAQPVGDRSSLLFPE